MAAKKQRPAIRQLSAADAARLDEDAIHQTLTRPVSVYQWAQSAARCAKQIVRTRGASEAWNALYWVRTYAVLTEMRKRSEDMTKSLSDTAHEAVVTAIEAIRTCFSEDELLYLEYRRHVECHLVQDGYRLQLDEEGKVIELRRRKLVGRDVTHDDTIAAIKRTLRRGKSEHRIVVDFATRTLAALQKLAPLVRDEAELATLVRRARSRTGKA